MFKSQHSAHKVFINKQLQEWILFILMYKSHIVLSFRSLLHLFPEYVIPSTDKRSVQQSNSTALTKNALEMWTAPICQSVWYTVQEMGQFFFVRQLLLFICCAPCACRQFRSALFLPCERAFLPAAFVARLSREWPFVLPKSRTLPGKKHRKTASAIYSAVSYRFYNVFCKKGFTNEFQKHII